MAYFRYTSTGDRGILRFIFGFGATISCIIIAAIVGWIANIIQILAVINLPLTGLTILKIVGIFVAPLGALLGLIGLF